MDLRSALKLSVAIGLGCAAMTLAHPASADMVAIQASPARVLFFGRSADDNNSSSGPGMFVGSDG